MYTYRTTKLNEEELKLINSIGISNEEFENLFDDILMSEVSHNSYPKGEYADKVNGIIFCGKKIELDEVLNLRKLFFDRGLVFEASISIYIHSRIKEFDFPSTKVNIHEVKKNYYKIYARKEGLSFIQQVNCMHDDKSELEIFYKKLQDEFQGFAIWADYEENLFYTNSDKIESLLDDIYKIQDYYHPKQNGIENGWYTKDSILEEYKKKLPIIEMCFYG